MGAEPDQIKDRLIDAALPHVAFDGWSEATFRAAVADADVTPVVAGSICPRGAVDLALAFHRRADDHLADWLTRTDLSHLKFRDRIAAAVRHRLELVADQKEAVRRGVTLFALPPYAADGTKAVWGTVDTIWEGLGDRSTDYNWYTKRATLSGVYGATVLFWLGDDSLEGEATWAFLDRRIENVMQFEKLKAKVSDSPSLRPFLALPTWALGQVRAPLKNRFKDLPGSLGQQE